MKKKPTKKVLIICHSFPPDTSIGGLRAAMFSKYLPAFGWEPYIFTCSKKKIDSLHDSIQDIEGLPDESKIFKAFYRKKDIDEILKNRSFFEKLKYVFFPEEAHPIGFYDLVMNDYFKLLKNYQFDVIWATSPHQYTLRVASEISKITNTPWVADLRDIEEQAAFRWDGFRAWFLRQRMIIRRNKITRLASAVVTVSKHHALTLRNKMNREVLCIHNGFDPEMFYPCLNHSSTKFDINYVGRLGWEKTEQKNRDPRPLFLALDHLINNNEISESDIQVNFYGSTDEKTFTEIIAPFSCRNIIKLQPRISYSEVPNVLRNSCAHLLLTQGKPGIMTTKLFESIGVMRPILFIPGDNDEIDLIFKKAKFGVSCKNVESIMATIKNWYEQWIAIQTIPYEGDKRLVKQYSRLQQAKTLAALFDKII